MGENAIAALGRSKESSDNDAVFRKNRAEKSKIKGSTYLLLRALVMGSYYSNPIYGDSSTRTASRRATTAHVGFSEVALPENGAECQTTPHPRRDI